MLHVCIQAVLSSNESMPAASHLRWQSVESTVDIKTHLAFHEMNQNDIVKNVQSLGNISPPIHDERKKAAINLRIILFGTLHL